jgi:hypothetical protein
MEDTAKPKIAIAYGVTGGRHPQMLGAAVAINKAFEEKFEVVAHFGFSGGAIVAAVMAADIHQFPGGPEEWIERSTPYGKYGKIGGFLNIFCNIGNLFWRGGLLNSSRLHDKVFKHILGDLRLRKPAYCGSFCVSHSKEVMLDLHKDAGRGIACSAALPFAISPMEVSNEMLISWGAEEELPEIVDDPQGSSWFADAGISSSLGVGIIDNAEAIRKAESVPGQIPIPVIGINIDPINHGHDKDFGGKSWYKKIWESCWGTIRANLHDDIREARSERNLQLCVIPTPEKLKIFSTKFDASLEENMLLYKTGYEQAQKWLEEPLSNDHTPVEVMSVWYSND